MTCPRCQHENPSDHKFCSECGAPLQRLDRSLQPASYPEVQQSLSEALARETATADILRVISSSPADVQPVFDTIAACAKRLCDARECAVFRFDGELIHLVAQADTGAAWAHALRSAYPRPPGSGLVTARAIQTGSLVHVPDVLADPEYELTEAARTSGVRTTLSVPMIREGEVIGAITVDRGEPKPFLDKQIGLVKTFADQAVIAIENVRLFTEVEARNRDLTATAEILQTISRSPTDVQPTFDAIAKSAAMLCRADLSGVHRFDGELIHFAAQYGRTAEEIQAVRQAFPQRPSRASATARCILSAAVVQIADHHDDPDIVDSLRMFRTVLAVPMLREGRPVGSISVARRVVEPF